MTDAGRADLAGLLRDVEHGTFPSVDLGITLLSAPAEDPALSSADRAADRTPASAVVLGFTGHIVIAADVSPDWLAAALPPGDPGAAFNPPFLRSLELHLNRRVNNIDVLTLAQPRPGAPDLPLRQSDLPDLPARQMRDEQTHPRVRRAMRYRRDLTVWAADGGVLVIGRGLAGRWEAAIEVDPAHRGKGLGRALAVAARHLVPEDRPIWAQIAPGNAASLRAFLAAGYLPVGQEALLVAHRHMVAHRHTGTGISAADPTRPVASPQP